MSDFNLDTWGIDENVIDGHITNLYDSLEDLPGTKSQVDINSFGQQAEEDVKNGKFGPERVDSYGIRKGDRAFRSNRP